MRSNKLDYEGIIIKVKSHSPRISPDKTVTHSSYSLKGKNEMV